MVVVTLKDQVVLVVDAVGEPGSAGIQEILHHLHHHKVTLVDQIILHSDFEAGGGGGAGGAGTNGGPIRGGAGGVGVQVAIAGSDSGGWRNKSRTIWQGQWFAGGGGAGSYPDNPSRQTGGAGGGGSSFIISKWS